MGNTMRKIYVTALLAAAAVTLTGCGGSNTETDECVSQIKANLAESGADRALTQDEIDACNNPTQRKFILGN